MRNIAIIGAGQSGLLLGIGLLKQNYNVTLLSDKHPEQIAYGPVLSSPAMFKTSLDIERLLGLNYWEDTCPRNKSVTFTLANHGNQSIYWSGTTRGFFQAVDQRVKIPAWMREFTYLGGLLVVKVVHVEDLEHLTKNHDLVIMASGKGKISQLFQRDFQKSIYDQPMRSLALAYVKGMTPSTEKSGVRVNIIPGVGEYFTMPGLTHNGSCEMMLFESIIGGDADCWDHIKTPQEQLNKMIELLKQYVPWEARHCNNVYLTDATAVLRGKVTPAIRTPILLLPSGRCVLGMGDVVVLNDPISGQGANNAAKCSKIYLDSILTHAHKPFDTLWMQQTFDKFWEKAQWTVQWTQSMLNPPKAHIMCLLKSAEHNPIIANMIAEAFDDLSQLYPWLNNPKQTEQKIKMLSQRMEPLSPLTNTPSLHSSPTTNHHQTESLNTLLEENQTLRKKFQSSPIMKLLTESRMQQSYYRNKLLDCLQIFSNYFEKTTMLRYVFSYKTNLADLAKKHLNEEYGHNKLLQQDRDNRPLQWDPILEATASWFSWQMLILDDAAKSVLIHQVLEASADIFFAKANKVISKYLKTDYFKQHDELDGDHSNMGIEELKNLDKTEHLQLLEIHRQGWAMLNTVCSRIACIVTEDISNTQSPIPLYKHNDIVTNTVTLDCQMNT